jgi:hypothetical protein
MIEKGKKGSSTKTGLAFEKGKDIFSLIKKIKGYSSKDKAIYYNGEEIARSYKKYALYKFLEGQGIDYTKIISKQLLPDEAVHVLRGKTLFVVEMKFQKVGGSVDEKLQTCDFKKKQYQKLVKPLGLRVEYIYFLSGWFKKPAYRDVLDYITSVGCHYYFDALPLSALDLPTP